ncbi:MAG: hypothetical protein JNK49_11915 [Planctomycetes bacterium]|nr:hypothetical protein [Planctomycetota bacterium]
MKKVSFALATLGLAAAAAAQNCNGAPAQQRLSNRAEFAASFYYDLGAHIFDLDVQVPITISSMRTWLYDQGVGNPPVPNQVGNTSQVDVFVCPGTRVGVETQNPATTPNSPWVLLGSGTMTVVDTGVGDGESVVVFNPPLNLTAGQWGVNVVYNAPTSGQNPGPLHCLGVAPNPATPYTDQFLTMTRDGIRAGAWTGTGVDSPNLRIVYTPAANSAQYVPLGAGCYFRPEAFYQSFPNSNTAPNLANQSISLINLGSNYLVVPGSFGLVTPSGTSLTAGAYGSSSSLDWDDALSTPIALPFANGFPYPTGSTSDITISSNGSIYLASVVNNDYAVCGASYGSIAPFRDGPARIAAYYHDLDLQTSGGLYYEVDPNNQWVRVTWLNVSEWGVPAAVNTMQVTLHDTGNIDIFYGSLGNRSNGNNAITGFTPGNGAGLPAAMNILASLPFQSGDGAKPPVLTMDARPVIGRATNIVTTNITPGTTFQLFIAGLSGVPSPISLAPFGMPNCFQHISPFTAFGVANSQPGGDFAVPFTIPNDNSYQNVQFFFQAAPFTPGLNTLGVLTSNGLCVKIGQ